MKPSALSRRWREDVPPVLPAWLTEARDHVRQHYPGDGLTESVLWALHAAGFGVAETGIDFPPELDDEEDDVLAPLRKVVCP